MEFRQFERLTILKGCSNQCVIGPVDLGCCIDRLEMFHCFARLNDLW